ncbi:MAG: cytochrome c3 family protein [Gemmatimonadota bacterium]|jgi:predicted CXXCH cytochrome family protein
MTGTHRLAGWTALVVAALAASVAACTDEVYRTIPAFEDPPAAAAGFLGYTDEASSQPVCGNCHIGQTADWEQTAHAGAWEDLQASGHASESCEGCHTVNELGNIVENQSVGWTATADPRYWDVQCESCHGPGLEHVTNPDATQPLAPVEVGADLTFGCGECHQGEHNPFIEEWSQSRHGNMNPYPQGREDCQSCHEGRQALLALGVDDQYLEKDGEDLLPIACAVCHDPHDATNEKQLRFPIDVPDVEQNLCMKCHHKRAVPDPGTSSRGPHSPQGPLLLGEDVGWIPPNFAYDQGRIVGTHGTTANPRLCATCHVSRLEVEDEAGNFVFNASGHLFKPIPCLDEDGVPTPSEECELSERSFNACAISGCHGSPDAARSAYIVATGRIADLVEELDALLDQVPESEFSSEDAVFTIAEGAEFNAGLGEITSSAIHNPFLTEALLEASIAAVEEEYGLAASPGLVRGLVLGRPPPR